MTARRKTSKKPTKPKRTARKKATPTKAQKRPKKMAKKKPAPKREEKKKVATAKRPQNKNKSVGEAFPPGRRGPRSSEQSGDLQGLSRLEAADSESVEELIEEGNAFEADVVAGVESAGDEEEVRTHEVPEDDVPGEYLDKD
jgi:hypothetical protein